MVGSAVVGQSSPIVLAFVTDEGFAMPTAVAIRSAIDVTDASRSIEIVLVGVDLSEDTWDKLDAAATAPNVSIERLVAEPTRFDALPDTGKYITRSTYQRFILPDVLADRDRILYLDGDILVRRDLSALFDADLGASATGGVRDNDLWYLSDDARGGIPEFDSLGLDPYAPLVNCGCC